MSNSAGGWREVGAGVLARRHTELDLTTGLVLGRERALVIDTRGDSDQGEELLAAVRDVTDLPLTVVLTHAHFDHCFGTAAFLPAPVYAHPRCAAAILATACAQRDRWVRHYRGEGDDGTARALAGTPDPPLPAAAPERLDLGGRTVVLVAPGRGHTDHDLAVHVPEASVVFAGDLLEQGAPPDFEDAYPREWAAAVGVLTSLGATTYVPGHGDPLTVDEVAAQHADLQQVADLAEAVAAGRITVADAAAHSPYPDIPWP
ncbi:MAG: MBL fold metallo-hydrolase [Pseudonocardia sp.]|nr:MBL fold metallo-hydrolase [Pseudonocardia sp.]